MSIDIRTNCECDECAVSLEDGDEAICGSCYDDLKTERDELKEKLDAIRNILDPVPTIEEDMEKDVQVEVEKTKKKGKK